MKSKLCTVMFISLAVASLVAVAQPAAPAAEAPAAAISTAAAPAPAANPDRLSATVPSHPGEVVDHIAYRDAKLTEVIENLARQAGMNYLLDPKIGFGQLGPNGQPIPEPSVTVRWEKVTPEQALAALLNNYNLQMVPDPKTQIMRITVRDPAAPDPLVTKIIQLKYAGPSNLLVSVQAILDAKRSKAVADGRTSQLVVLATEKEMTDVDRLVERLDTRTREVLIESRLLETYISPTTAKGIDWAGTFAAHNVSFGNGHASGQTTTSLPGTPTSSTTPNGRVITGSTPTESAQSVLTSILGDGGLAWNTASGFTPGIGFLNSEGVHAVLSFLNQYAETKVISTPRAVTLDNEQATIEVGTLYPIVNTTAGTQVAAGGSSISYSNLTVRLEVTPRISANNYVQLKVSPRVTRLGEKVTSIVGGVANTVDSFSKREIDTTVMIPSGNTLVMGGLIEDNIQLQSTKVPLLGDIPGIGLLFRHDSKVRQKSNMLVFLTPTIIEDTDFQPTATKFLQTPVPTKDTIEPDWSAWDSGKAKDWSKPTTTSAN